MPLYRKKPIEVRAIQYTGDNFLGIVDYFYPWENAQAVLDKAENLLVITVDENYCKVPIGSYVVLDIKGYLYPCDKEVFEASHELVTKPLKPTHEGAEH